MRIAVIQDRPIICDNGEFYTYNPIDIEKYLYLCDNVTYCASLYKGNAPDLRYATKIDLSTISIRIVKKNPLRELMFPSNFNKKIIESVIRDADIVVIKVPSITIGRLAFQILQNSSKKYVVEVVGCAWDSFWYHSYKGKLMAFYCMWLTKRMCMQSNNVVYVTNRFLQNRYPNVHHNIGCSNVVLDSIENDLLMNRIQRIENMPDNAEVKLGTAAAINERYKGQQFVIEAIGKMRRKGKIYHYYLAGGGDQKYLMKIAEKYRVTDLIHFLGQVPKQKMIDFYDSLDIYIHPSMAEGLPRVVIEAESRAVPTMGANASGTPELLDEDCVFKIKSAEDICRVLISFDKKKMQRVSRNNFERSKNYSKDVLCERRKYFYDNLI